MRNALFVLLLTGCSYNITLYPRGGGDEGTGYTNDASPHMEIDLRGQKYVGDRVSGGGGAIGLVGTKPIGMGLVSVQKSALLVGPGGMLRCEFMLRAPTGGNGVCVDSGERVYDMLIK